MTLADVLQWWSFAFLGVVVYYLGKSVKTSFPELVAKPWFKRTIVFHAPIAATLIAILPIFPMPQSIGDAIGTRLLFGLVAGICCAWLYKATMRLIGADSSGRAEQDIEPKP